MVGNHVGPLERDRRQRTGFVVQSEAQVVRPDAPRAHGSGVPDAEHRRGVARPARLQVPDELLQLVAHEPERQLQIHALRGHQIIGAQKLCRGLEKGNTERLVPLAPDGQARRHGVAAVLLEVVADPVQRGVQIEARDAAPGAPPGVSVPADQERRPSVALDQPRRHDSDHAGVPRVGSEHERPVVGLEHPLGELDGLVEDALVQLLAPCVEGLELASERRRFVRIVGEEQAQAVARVADPSRRVQARGEDEADVTRLERSTRETGGLHQRAQPRPARTGEHLQPVPHEDPVLPRERDHVRDGRERHEVQKVQRQVGGHAERRHQGLRELERDACPAQVLIRRRAIGATGIEDRRSRWQLVSGQVVVGDDDVDPRRSRLADGLDGGDPAVARDDQPGAEPPGLRDSGRAEVVAVPEAVRHEGMRARAHARQHAGEQRRGTLAVHVVVTVDEDRRAGAHRGDNELDRARHISPRERIRQSLEVGAEKGLGEVGGGQTALHQDGGEWLGDVEVRHEDRRELGIGGRGHRPAGGNHSAA